MKNSNLRNTKHLTPAFLWGILLPGTIYVLTLKTKRIIEREEAQTFLDFLCLMASDILLLTALGLIFSVLLRFLKSKRLSFVIFIFLQILFFVFFLLEFLAHKFKLITGTHLTFSLIYDTIANFENKKAVFKAGGDNTMLKISILLGSSTLLLPWLIQLMIQFIQGSNVKCLIRTGNAPNLLLLTVGLFCLIATVIPGAFAGNVFKVQNSTLSILRTIKDHYKKTDLKQAKLILPTFDATLKPKNNRLKKNLVILLLESTRAESTSLYPPYIDTTPYLKQLSRRSLVAEKAYAVVPHTSKCLVAIHCGLPPNLTIDISESEENGIPGKCLPKLLEEVGYSSVYFQSPTEFFENRRALIRNIGHQKFYSGNRMPSGNFEKINYFGYEDRIMLGPSKNWLRNHISENRKKTKPFMATYLTISAHHEYGTPSWHKSKKFPKHRYAITQKYYNSILVADLFLKSLIEQYKQLGLYKNTVFVIVGDHGEAFREHDQWAHSSVVHKEVLQIPLVIHAPSLIRTSRRVKVPVNQLDLLPTIVDLLGFSITNNTFLGQSLLSLKNERDLFASCWRHQDCLTKYNAQFKFLHFFGNKQEQAYDLVKDPFEKTNILTKFLAAIEWRNDALSWYNGVRALYEKHKQPLKKKKIRNRKR